MADPSILAARAARMGGTGWITRRSNAGGGGLPVVSFSVQPTIVGSGKIGSNQTLNFGTAAGAVLTGVLRRGATVLIGSVTNGQTYTPVAGDDQATITLDVTATIGAATALASAIRAISYADPTFSDQPTITPVGGSIGSIFVIGSGVAGPAATLTVEYFRVNGVDKTSEVVGLSWNSAGKTAGTITFRMRATNSQGFALSAERSAVLSNAAAAPSAFAALDWILADSPSVGGNTLTVDIRNLAFNGGSALTALQYSLNAGVSWTALAGLGIGPRSIVVLAATPASIQIRAVNAVGEGPASDVKTETPTVLNVAPLLSNVSISAPNIVNYTSSEPSTLFWKVDDNATQTGPQVAAGGGYVSGSFATTSGVSDIARAFSGTPAGLRYLHLVLRDGPGLYSVVSSLQFNFIGGDTVAPTITSTSPIDNITGVAITTSPTLTFSENIVFDVGTIVLRENNGGWVDLEVFDVATEQGTGNGQVSIAGSVLTINPTASLTNGREYAVRIAAGAIKDTSGNAFAGIANDTTMSFTAVASGGATQRNPYSGFDDAAAYVLTTGVTISASKLRYANPTEFDEIQQNYGYRTPVTPSIPYTIALTADNVTAGPKMFRIIAQFWQGQQFDGPPPNGGPSTILAETSSGDLSFSTGETKSFVVTPPSDCTHIQLVISVRQASTTAVFDSLTVTG